MIQGSLYPLRAFGMLRRHHSLWGYVLWPVLLNVAIGTLLYVGLLLLGFQAIDTLMATLPSWLESLGWLLRIVLILILLIVIGYIVGRFGVILGSPFYSKLSEQLELIETGVALPVVPVTFFSVLRDLWRALGFELKKLLLVIVIWLPLLLLNVVPVAGQFVVLAGVIALGALIACLDFFDPPLERRQLAFREKLSYIKRTFPRSAGFGLTCLALVSIPFLNLLFIPLCVTAGTLFFCDQLQQKR